MTPDIHLPTSWQSTLAFSVGKSVDRHNELSERLARFGQEHVLRFWDDLSDEQRSELAAQIDALDLPRLKKLFSQQSQSSDRSFDTSAISQPHGVTLDDPNPRFDVEHARATGNAVLNAGTIGVVIVAGGQGTRLGFPHPKGMYPIGPLSGASLFEIHFNKVMAAAKRCGRSIPIYVMTSSATHDETIQFLKDNDRFGFPAEDLFVFCQGEMPAVDQATGKLLMSDKSSLCLSPDGHGGMLAALDRSGAFDDMQSRGIEHLFYLQIDNPLVDICGVDVIGHHVLFNSQATTLVTRKTVPTEKVGVVSGYEGKTQIIEYSDLSPEVTAIEKDDGQLLLWAGNIAVHVWDVSFLESLARSDEGLPFHFANKKVPHLDEHGGPIEPKQPNAIKFERFIFDLLPIARRSIVIEVDRTTSFAPLKNPTGSDTDSPEYVQQAIVNLHRSLLERAGIQVAHGVVAEIHPSLASDVDSLTEKIPEGTTILEDVVLR